MDVNATMDGCTCNYSYTNLAIVGQKEQANSRIAGFFFTKTKHINIKRTVFSMTFVALVTCRIVQ